MSAFWAQNKFSTSYKAQIRLKSGRALKVVEGYKLPVTENLFSIVSFFGRASEKFRVLGAKQITF